MKNSHTLMTLLSGFVGGAGAVALFATGGLSPPAAAPSPAPSPVEAPAVREAPRAPAYAAVVETVPISARLRAHAASDPALPSDRTDPGVSWREPKPVVDTAPGDPGLRSHADPWREGEDRAELDMRDGTTPATHPTTRAEVLPEPSRLPAGSLLRARLETPLSSRTAAVGDPVRARLSEDVTVAGRTLLPAGTLLRGLVREARAAGRVKGNGRLALAFTGLELPGGGSSDLHAAWQETAEGKRKRDTAIVGGSAAGGALLGQLLGGDSESTVGGAVLGGAIGTGVVLANRGRELELEAGRHLVLETRSDTLLPR